MNKEKLIEYLKNYDITYDYDEDYRNIYNACNEYMCDTQDFSIEECFNDIITYDDAEERAKYELQTGGLVRLYYFLGDANCNYSMFRLNGYGNLEELCAEDFEDLIDDIISRLEE